MDILAKRSYIYTSYLQSENKGNFIEGVVTSLLLGILFLKANCQVTSENWEIFYKFKCLHKVFHGSL